MPNSSEDCDFLFRLRGNRGGRWPAAVMVLSNQVYDVQRYQEGETDPDGNNLKCTVKNVVVSEGRRFIFNYLREAALRGTKVLIRIFPSPGNFNEATQSGWPDSVPSRILLTDPIATPANGEATFCGGAHSTFRSIDDIAREMKLIYDLNINSPNNIPPANFAFIPANEPNIEWYSENTQPSIATADPWIDMNLFFSNLYRHIRQAYPAATQLRVLTPTMAQGRFAESQNIENCDFFDVDSPSGNQSGYEFMSDTYTGLSDGFAWHNYWAEGGENWGSEETPCSDGSDHIFQYFPLPWRDEIRARVRDGTKDAFIVEADLLSPCQSSMNTLKDKNDDAGRTVRSIQTFVAQEQGSEYVLIWLLNESPYSVTPDCRSLPGRHEIRWHQAYAEGGSEAPWFRLWWTGAR